MLYIYRYLKNDNKLNFPRFRFEKFCLLKLVILGAKQAGNSPWNKLFCKRFLKTSISEGREREEGKKKRVWGEMMTFLSALGL